MGAKLIKIEDKLKLGRVLKTVPKRVPLTMANPKMVIGKKKGLNRASKEANVGQGKAKRRPK